MKKLALWVSVVGGCDTVVVSSVDVVLEPSALADVPDELFPLAVVAYLQEEGADPYLLCERPDTTVSFTFSTRGIGGCPFEDPARVEVRQVTDLTSCTTGDPYQGPWQSLVVLDPPIEAVSGPPEVTCQGSDLTYHAEVVFE